MKLWLAPVALNMAVLVSALAERGYGYALAEVPLVATALFGAWSEREMCSGRWPEVRWERGKGWSRG